MPIIYPWQPSTVHGACSIPEPCVVPAPVKCVTSCQNLGRDVETMCTDDIVIEATKYYTYKDGTERYTAPENAIENALKQSLQRFTRESRILRRRAVMTTQKGVADYYIEPLNDEQIHAIESICVDGECIPFADGICCDEDECASNGSFNYRGFTFEIPNKIVFAERSCRDGAKITVKYIAETTNDACSFDKVVWDRHKQAILSGAAAHLLTLPSWEWTAPSFGLNEERRYLMLLAQAQIEAARRYGRISKTMYSGRHF